MFTYFLNRLDRYNEFHASISAREYIGFRAFNSIALGFTFLYTYVPAHILFKEICRGAISVVGVVLILLGLCICFFFGLLFIWLFIADISSQIGRYRDMGYSPWWTLLMLPTIAVSLYSGWLGMTLYILRELFLIWMPTQTDQQEKTK